MALGDLLEAARREGSAVVERAYEVAEEVTRLNQSQYGSMAAATGIGDQRVLIIKLADRLHNMRTLHHLPPAKQRQKSREVLDGFAPLARRLGRDSIARELADLARAALARNRHDPAPHAGAALARPPGPVPPSAGPHRGPAACRRP